MLLGVTQKFEGIYVLYGNKYELDYEWKYIQIADWKEENMQETRW